MLTPGWGPPVLPPGSPCPRAQHRSQHLAPNLPPQLPCPRSAPALASQEEERRPPPAAGIRQQHPQGRPTSLSHQHCVLGLPGPGRRIRPALCQPRWSRCCRRGFSAALPCKEKTQSCHRGQEAHREPHICSAVCRASPCCLSLWGRRTQGWEARPSGPTGQDAQL